MQGHQVANVVQLAELIGKKQVNDREMIEELIDKENGNLDCIVYGRNLTFVNLEDLKMYEMELKGVKTVYADYTIDGVGDNGVILVLPHMRDGDQGIRVTMYDLELVFVKNNHVFVDEYMKKPDYIELMRRLGALGDGNTDQSTLSPDEWEVAYLYLTYVLRKRGQPEQTRTNSRKDRGKMHIMKEDITYLSS
ncbi:hypothetical protein POM88_038071 [Heracleum sosnowskyi]|uniref:mRNA (guanine-N(7))-methyltransferase n=1 Tax=Heracleum sosnowskyi TaxID=360622 RepID=A0AAD8HRA8_9APIA|nr:hypothetical protein POM88_038071 [Heracleum sosnowskyi]